MSNNNVVDRIAENFAARAPKSPTASIIGYQLLTKEIAKVVVAHSFDGGIEENRVALANLLGNRGSVVANSFRKLDSGNKQRTISVGFVRANVMSEDLSDERKSTMTQLAKNVLMDEMDNTLWQVAEVAGRKVIRRTNNEDLSILMSETASVGASFKNAGTSLEVAALRTDVRGDHTFVAFVNPNTSEMDYGYVIASASDSVSIIPADTSNEVAVVSPDLVVQAAYDVDPNNRLTQQVKRHKEEAGFPDSDVMKAYYQREFGFSPEFFAKLSAQIDSQASA